MTVSLSINNRITTVDADPSTPLLWVLRDYLGMTGTKFGCGIAQCGACTVLIDGRAMQRLWIEMNVPQCGYCQSGMLMAAAGLLNQIPKPTDDDIDQYVSNICRCGTYPRVRAAIHKAAEAMQDKGRQL